MCGKVEGSNGSSNAGSASKNSPAVGLTADEMAKLDPSIKELYLLAKQAAAGDAEALQKLMDQLPEGEKEKLAAQGQEAYLAQLLESLLSGSGPVTSSTDSTQLVSSTSGASTASSGYSQDKFLSQGLWSRDMEKYLQQTGDDQGATSSSTAPSMSAAQFATQSGTVAA